MKVLLSQKRLKQVISYDPESGDMTRIDNGRVAGTINGDGYRSVMVDGRLYQAHRLAWLYVHGSFPPDCIDHINGIRTDNRIENLRPATKSQNTMNSKAPSTNSTGVKNVSRNRGGYLAGVKVGGRRVSKWFADLESASACADILRNRLHGEYACKDRL